MKYIFITILCIAAAGTAYFFWPDTEVSDVAQDTSFADFPVTGETDRVEGGESTPQIKTKNGGEISADSLVNYTDTQQLSEYFYRINSPDDTYGIYYNQETENGMVLLFSENLSLTRLLAERKLKEVTGLSDQAICDLDIRVLTNEMVNRSYSGFDLGFSFCPGSESLPD